MVTLNRMNSASQVSSSTQDTNIDPYNDNYLDEGYPSEENATEFGDDTWGEDTYEGAAEGMSESPILTVGEYEKQLLEQVKVIRGDTSLSAQEKTHSISRINKLLLACKKEPDNSMPSPELLGKIEGYQMEMVEQETAAQENSEMGEGEEGVDGTGKEAIIQSIENLKEQIKASDKIPASKQSELFSKLDRAKSNLEINLSDSSIEQATETISEVGQEFDSLIQLPKGAIELASTLNLNAEDIQGAAENNGVDLDNLPNPPNEKVMNMLKELGVPSDSNIQEFNQIRDERKSKMSELKTKLEGQDAEWRRESENPPSESDFKIAFSYWEKKDDLYQKLQSKEKEMQSSIVGALNALGYSASAATSPDQISIGGSTLDFIDEKTSTLGFSATLSKLEEIQTIEDFYPAPKNTESEDENIIVDIRPDGYPRIKYTVD